MEKMARTKGRKYTLPPLGTVRKCQYPNCDKIETYNGRWKEHWHPYNDDGYLCKKHHFKLFTYPKRTSEYFKKYNSRRTKEQQKIDRSKVTPEQRKKYNAKNTPKLLCYASKQHLLTFNPRKGECEWCGKKKGDEYIDHDGKLAKVKVTNKHHIEYIPIFIWFATVELCKSCHVRETERLKKIEGGLVYNNNSLDRYA